MPSLASERGSSKTSLVPCWEWKGVWSEIAHLKRNFEERDSELESTKKDSLVLQQRQEKAEKDMLKHFEEAKLQKSKLLDEIKFLKSAKAKDNDTMIKKRS